MSRHLEDLTYKGKFELKKFSAITALRLNGVNLAKCGDLWRILLKWNLTFLLMFLFWMFYYQFFFSGKIFCALNGQLCFDLIIAIAIAINFYWSSVLSRFAPQT